MATWTVITMQPFGGVLANPPTGSATVELRAGWDTKQILACSSEFLAIKLESGAVSFTDSAFPHISELFSNPTVGLVYGKHYIEGAGDQPCIEYTAGGVRDDFMFGTVAFVRTKALMTALEKYPVLAVDGVGGWYAARLALSLDTKFLCSETLLYHVTPQQVTESEKEHFAYVDPRNATAQKQFERVFTEYAKLAKFYLPQRTATVAVDADTFPVEASIIIPVRNRKGTVADAVDSALRQKTNFPFNCIVVDNHSTDGTTEILAAIAKKDSRLIHHIPAATNLGIGGCWDVAIRLSQCGRFVAQLDSDDLYIDENVLTTIVTKMRSEKLAGLAASYRLVDVSLNDLPPGIIDHKEWTDENGHNNGLRINGFGAPRAFFTPIARSIGFKNVSYGEDYAMMLAITRNYKLGRIYEPLYLCRRWDGNSDAQPTIAKVNAFSVLKDGFRAAEIAARKELAKK